MHIEYLGNMGVRASFAVALAHSSKLWGLIVGHHGSPRWMDGEQRAAVDIIGQVMASRLHSFDTAARDARQITRNRTMQSIRTKLASRADMADCLIAAAAELLQLTNAGGALIRLAGNSHVIGRVPPLADAQRALSCLLREACGKPIAVDNLGLRFPELVSCSPQGSGALLLPLSEAGDDAILWFRPELMQAIVWAGDPNKQAEPDAIDGRLSPRKSFEQWKEIVGGHCAPWHEADLVLAAELQRLIESVMAARERQEIEARFRFAAEAGRLGVWELDLPTNRLTASSACQRIFCGNDVGGFTYEDMHSAIHPDDRSLIRAAFARSTANGDELAIECRVLRSDGTSGSVRVQARTERAKDGTPLKLAGIALDITDRIRMEAQLHQSQKMHAIGRVTAGVAHDFNNLLQALSGSLEMLLEGVVDQPALEWGQVALRATKRGRDLTDRLLSFSRQQTLKPTRVAVDVLFGDLKQLINHLFETNTKGRTELVMVPCAAGLAVLADFAQLEAALINLAVNARDAMSSGGRLRISAYETDADPAIVPPGRYTVISVADTGTGMDARTLGQAVEPFFTTKGLNGTGLGLSMVHGFARQSGGEAHITSVVGEGTTIDLWLPSGGASPDVAPAPATIPVALSGRILVVDDSPDVLLVTCAFLTGVGLEVTCKASGDLALEELAAGRRFDVIITDFAMPGMNGLELLTLAHEIDQRMVGIMITGFSDPEIRSNLNNAVVLRKPFSRAELIEKVRAMIAEGRKLRT